MTTSTTTAPTFDPAITLGRPEVATAVEEHTQAQQLLAVLEEKVRDGDPGVKPSELADAREVVEFARLRVEAAQRAAVRREREERAAAYTALGDQIHQARPVTQEQIVEAFTDALTGLDRLAALAIQRSDTLRAIAQRAAHLVQVADKHGERDVLRAAGIHNATMAGIGGPAQIIMTPPGAPVYYLTDLAPEYLVLAALGRAQIINGRHIDADRGPDPDSALADAERVIPGVAAAMPAHSNDQEIPA